MSCITDTDQIYKKASRYRKIDPDSFEKILSRISNPSSYLGIERNVIIKNDEDIDLKVGLAFPDLYRLGMGNLGLKILYNIINNEPRYLAERVFAPEEDMLDTLKSLALPLFSLETKSFVKDLDILGFTIPYELSYTNILYILKAADIPLESFKRRSGQYPIVIGGGSGVYNPEPLADFFDLFVIGDAEEIILKILYITKEIGKDKKDDLLYELAKLDGIYVPSYYDVSYHENGDIDQIKTLNPVAKERIERIWVKDLKTDYDPFRMILPIGSEDSDRASVEIDRGCSFGCRFCQAGITYRPVRERKREDILDLIQKRIETSGIDTVSLTSLSSGDYSDIGELLSDISDKYSESYIDISLPSLRPATVTDEMVKAVGKIKKSGFTIAPEAGTERLRKVINKKVTDEEIKQAIKILIENRWEKVKLYFMISLPTEQDEDIIRIGTLGKELLSIKVDGRSLKSLTLSISNFVPKPHTPFQWSSQDTIETLKSKQAMILNSIKHEKRISVKFHNIYTSRLEAIFSRADRRFSKILKKASDRSIAFDAWKEKFNNEIWEEILKSENIDPDKTANRNFDLDQKLPWDHIDVAVSKKHLIKEFKLAHSYMQTEDCRYGNCFACGIDPNQCEDYKENFSKKETVYNQKSEIKIAKTKNSELKFRNQQIGNHHRYRFHFSKRKLARFISHLQLTQIIKKSLRELKLPVIYSQGFSPSPKISFDNALPLGMESLDEKFDLLLSENIDSKKLIEAINKTVPNGVEFTQIYKLSENDKPLNEAYDKTVYSIIFTEKVESDLGSIKKKIAKFYEADSLTIEREKNGKTRKIDLKRVLLKLELEQTDNKVSLNYTIDKRVSPSVKISELSAFFLPNIKGGKFLKKIDF